MASVYTKDLAARICAEMATGKSLRSVCAEDGMPAESTVRLWAVEDRDGFAAHYARAREAQMEALGEDILEIADDTRGDFKKNADGVEVVDSEAIQRSKLRVDARKWLMSKIAPKRYGDRVDATIGNPDGSPLQERSPREIAMGILAAVRAAQADENG